MQLISRLILLIVILFSQVSVKGQLQLAPLKSNHHLMETNSLIGVAALDDFTSRLVLNIQSGAIDSVCINLGKLAGGFKSLEIIRPAIPKGGVATVSNECIVYEADDRSSRISDTLILLALDVDTFEYHYQLIVNVIPSRGLPFVDDFSYDGPYPDPALWLDNYTFVNYGLAKDPPSVGVVTFDGVDETGRAYGLGPGSSDTLSSTFLNMNNVTEPVLEFYYQPRGNGFEGFPREEDSLILEFRNSDGRWVHLFSLPGIDWASTPEFEFVQLPIPDEFTYDGFQFRFRNLSRRDGILGTWHLDYIQVRDASISTEVLPDVALRKLPTPLFSRYTAIPSAHFKDFVGAYIADSFYISVGNYFPTERIMNDSRVLIRETNRDEDILVRSDDENLFKSSATSGDGKNQIDLAPGTYRFRNAFRTRGTIVSRIESMQINEEDSLNFQLSYTFENNERSPAFERNNTVKLNNIIDDYYAYDDGTAEAGIYIPGGREFDMVALQYESPVDDSLKGVRIYFPHVFAQGDRQRWKLMVWGANLEDGPLYEKIYDAPVFPDRFGEIIGSFTTFALRDDRDRNIAIPIPAGKFHVGWQQLSSSSTFGLYVGFDREHPEATQYIRYNALGVWDTISSGNGGVSGAIMIRPVFKPVIPTSVKEPGTTSTIQLYPNPVNDLLQVRGLENSTGQAYRIMDVHGKSVKSGRLQGPIFTGDLPPGLYFLQVNQSSGSNFVIEKFIKQ